MIEHLTLIGAVIALFASFGFGMYSGAKHVEEMSRLTDTPDRPEWLQESVEAVNDAIGRPSVEEVDPDDDGDRDE